MATTDITDRQVCLAYLEAAINKAGWPYDILSANTSQPVKVCIRAMERAHDRGYIEYGVSLRTGWLTDEGKALLRKEEPTSEAA